MQDDDRPSRFVMDYPVESEYVNPAVDQLDGDQLDGDQNNGNQDDEAQAGDE
jgi:hypothetical protein